MTQNIPLAIVAGLVATVVLAWAATVQHAAVGDQASASGAGQSLGGRQLVRLLRSARWWAGMALSGVGAGLQVLAVLLAPIMVVQPIGILAVPWTAMMASRVHRRPIPARAWAAVALTVAGTAWFTVVAVSHAADYEVLDDTRLVSGTLVAFAIAGVLALVGARGPVAWRCFAWSSGGAVIYALETGMIKAVGEYLATRSRADSGILWFLLVSLVLGMVLAVVFVQQGYATGPAEVVVGSLNATMPLAAVAFGAAVLGEGANLTPLAIVAMALAGALSVAGVVLLSRSQQSSAGSAAVQR